MKRTLFKYASGKWLKINLPPQAVPLLFKEGKKTPSTYICRKMGKVSYFLVVSESVSQ